MSVCLPWRSTTKMFCDPGAAGRTIRNFLPSGESIGLEFAGHHGFTFAHDLARRGYQIVNVLPAVTKRTKEIDPVRLRPHPWEFQLYFDV